MELYLNDRSYFCSIINIIQFFPRWLRGGGLARQRVVASPAMLLCDTVPNFESQEYVGQETKPNILFFQPLFQIVLNNKISPGQFN